MRYRRWLALFLCCCVAFSMTACGSDEKEEPAEVTEEAVNVDNGTLQEDSVAVAIGKTTVPYNEYKVYYYFMKNQYEDVLTADVWNYKADNTTIGQKAIEDVLRLIIQVKVINKAAISQGVMLAADEKEEADYNASQYFLEMSEEAKKENGITLSVLTKVFEENKLAEKMYNVVMGKVDTDISAEQEKATKVQLIYFPLEEKEKADDVYAKVVKEAGNSFYALARANSFRDEVETLIGGLDTRTNLVQAVSALKKYEYTGVVQEADGYYIAYCVQKPGKKLNAQYKNEIIEERQIKAFQEAYKTWSAQYEVKVSKSLLVK